MNRACSMLPLVITTCHVIATVAHAAGKEQNIVEVPRKNLRVDHRFAVSKQRFTLGMPEGRAQDVSRSMGTGARFTVEPSVAAGCRLLQRR